MELQYKVLDIKQELKEIRQPGRYEEALSIGSKVAELKEGLDYGKYQEFVQSLGVRTCQRFMRIYKNREELEKRHDVSYLKTLSLNKIYAMVQEIGGKPRQKPEVIPKKKRLKAEYSGSSEVVLLLSEINGILSDYQAGNLKGRRALKSLGQLNDGIWEIENEKNEGGGDI